MVDDAAAHRMKLAAPEPPRRGHLKLGEPHGTKDRVLVISRYLERSGKPWFPVTGEAHYSRLPRRRWAEVLGHARAGGLNSIASYVLWQAHEPHEGRFRWDGNLDLRAFVELAAEFGLDVIVRMGPWAHGEARHGGFPDWLLHKGLATRTNDPGYLELVRRLYAQIITQISGLTHADGGPVIGVQMDNELYDQPQHLATLRTTAEDLGLEVPIWSATGWGGAQVPETLLPVYSAYSEGFWEETDVEWPAFAARHFRYREVRDDLTVGKDLREALDGITLAPGEKPLGDDDLPFATCELGGGMHVAYHRRPLVAAEDVANLALAKIGSGSIWQGYYMYAGGTQRVGPQGTEQESHATGYPNDVPSRSYDFYAPVGEYQQIRPHHHLLRRQHLWLDLDGPAIATMVTTVGGGSEDPSELRWAVRSDGHRGYLFLSTYQPPKKPIDPQPGVRFALEFDDEVVTVPSRPLDLPQGVSVAWPLRYPLSDALVLRSATAQVLTRICDDDGVDILVLVSTAGIPVELVVEGPVQAGGAGIAEALGEDTLVTLTEVPGADCVVDLPGVRVLVVDEDTADQIYRLEFAGRERLVLSEMPVYVQGERLIVHADRSRGDLAFIPAPQTLTSGDGVVAEQAGRIGLWRRWSLAAEGAGVHRIDGESSPTAPAPPPPPTRGGPLGRLSAPTDFSGAAVVPVEVPQELLAGVDRVLLRITWTGDVGRALIDDEVISDHYWHGRVWDVDLTPHRDRLREHGLELQLLPWREATGVWVDPAARGVADGISIASLEVIRIARIAISAEPRSPGVR